MTKGHKKVLLFKKLRVSWQKAILKLAPLGGFSAENEVTLFHEGDEAFNAIFKAIREAKHSIYVETYILQADKIGNTLRDLLIEARQREVQVTLIYDHFGSSHLTSSFFLPMKEAGIKVLGFNPIWPWRRHGPLSFRDHRKIIVIDEKVGFCGGMNLSEDYAGPRLGKNRFRDSMALVRGPAVKDLLSITKETIAETEFEKKPDAFAKVAQNNSPEILKLFFKTLFNFSVGTRSTSDAEAKSTLVQVLRSNTRRNLTHIQKSMEEIVNRAVDYCYFTTPYFLPQAGLRKALLNARLRGVDVRILTLGISDVPLMRYANQYVYRSLLEKGVRIYEMTQKTLHAKLSTIDGIYASVGSYNLDHWSARRNLEVSLSILDRKIALELKDQFKKDLGLSVEVDKKKYFTHSLPRRFFSWLVYLFYKL